MGLVVTTVRQCCTVHYCTVLESQGSRYSTNLCAQPHHLEGCLRLSLVFGLAFSISGTAGSVCFLSGKGCASRGRRGLKHLTRASSSCQYRKKDTSPVAELRFPRKRVLLGRARPTISAQLFSFAPSSAFLLCFSRPVVAGRRIGATPFSQR